MMSDECLVIRNLAVGYGGRAVRSGLSFSLCAGELVSMLGRNGCGKSTLLRTLAGLQPSVSGYHSLDGLSAAERSRRVALVLTERVALENTTVHEVVAMGRYPYTDFLGGLREVDEQIVARSLERVGWVEPSRSFSALSDGERQRVLIAKALAQNTPVILLDEPTAHLDLPSRIALFRLLRSLAHDEGKMVLVSTHELDLASEWSDRIMLFSEQEVLLDTPSDLHRADAFNKAFAMDVEKR